MRLTAALPDRNDVHVWTVELAPSPRAIGECSHSISADEHERASQFRFEHLKTAFTLSRGILRALLGRYLAIEPGRVRFAYGERGKPRLTSPDSQLAFNLSHSGKLASYAFTLGCELGLDIEEVRPVHDQENIVRRHFSREECEEWLELDSTQRDEAFFRCWTRKEAYIKALGDGLSIPLDSFRVSLRPGEPAALIRDDGDAAAPGKWMLCSLEPAEGYAGALAIPDRSRTVHTFPLLTPDEVLDLISSPDPFPAPLKSTP